MAQLSIYRGGRLEGVFYLPDKPVLIGRADGVDIQLLDSRVSRRHAVIRESVAGFIIQDLDTKNGTMVNDEAIERSLLFHSDAVVIGGYTLKFLEEDEASDISTDTGMPAQQRTGGLQLPDALGARGPDPRAKTSQRPGEHTPQRVNRMDRREAAAARARAAVAGAGRAQAPRDVSEGPLVEAMGAGGRRQQNSLSLDFSLSDFDSGGEPQDPRRASPGTAQKRSPDLPRGTRSGGEVQDGRPEIRELDKPDGLRFLPEEGTTSCGFEPDDDVILADDGVGTLFTVLRRGLQMEVRAGSSLRPILLNGAPVVSAEAFPGDVFTVGGRRFVIQLTLGEAGVPTSTDTVLGIDSGNLNRLVSQLGTDGLARRLEERLLSASEGDAADDVPVAIHRHGDTTASPPVDDDLPRELIEAEDEWVADSLRSAQAVSAAAAAGGPPPTVHEPLEVEAGSGSHPGRPVHEPDASWADDWLASDDGDQNGGDTLRTAIPVDPADVSNRRRRKLGAGKLPPPSFLPPITSSDAD